MGQITVMTGPGRDGGGAGVSTNSFRFWRKPLRQRRSLRGVARRH